MAVVNARMPAATLVVAVLVSPPGRTIPPPGVISDSSLALLRHGIILNPSLAGEREMPENPAPFGLCLPRPIG